MTIRELISAIELKHKDTGIVVPPPATIELIQEFERRVGFELPPDFKEFYLICNGFECNEDIFTFVALEHMLQYEQDYGDNWFHFAEYMIYSDAWSLRKNHSGEYEIFNKGEKEIVLTSSLCEFLHRFYIGNVFDKGGLYDWHKEKSG